VSLHSIQLVMTSSHSSEAIEVPYQLDFCASEFEDLLDYLKHFFHPVRCGDLYSGSRYKIPRKLAHDHGRYCTMWLAEDLR